MPVTRRTLVTIIMTKSFRTEKIPQKIETGNCIYHVCTYHIV